jgi:hypothetical protein
MALAEQPSSESRLLSRLTREHATPSSRVLSRLGRHSEPGILSRSSERRDRTTQARRNVGYSPHQGSGMLDRIVRREGLQAVPNSVGLGLSSLSTDFVVSAPPWLARSEAVPAGESPVRRHRAARPSAPVITGWGAVQAVPGSSPVARNRAGALSRASGISPPSLEPPLSPVSSAPRASGFTPAARSTGLSTSPVSAGSHGSRASYTGRPLSRTVAAVHSSAAPIAATPSNSLSSYSPSVRAPREHGSSRDIGRGFSVARSTARRASGTALVFPTASPTPRASQRVSPAASEAPGAPAATTLSRQAATRTPFPVSQGTHRPNETRWSTATAATASPLARATARSSSSPEVASSRRHGSGAARRAATLGTSSLALAEAMPAAARSSVSEQSITSSRPLTRQASNPLPTEAMPATGISASTARVSSVRLARPAAYRTVPTPLARAIHSTRGPLGGALGHVAARAASVESATSAYTPAAREHSSVQARGPLARSFGRALPAPLQQSHRARVSDTGGLELTAPSAAIARSAGDSAAIARSAGDSAAIARSAGDSAAIARSAGDSAATSAKPRVSAAPVHSRLVSAPTTPAATRTRTSAPSSRALARLSVTSTASKPVQQPLASSLTSPLAGSPVARTLARFGGSDSSLPGGISRTRSLTASAELGMAAPLRRASVTTTADTSILPVPGAAPSALRTTGDGFAGQSNVSVRATRTTPATAQTASGLSRSSSGSPAALPTATGTRPQPPQRHSRSPLTRAFARAGQSASAPQAAYVRQRGIGAARRTGERALVTSFEAALPSAPGTLHRSAEVEVTGPGRGFTQARRIHRQRNESRASAASSLSLTVGAAPPAYRTLQAEAPLARQAEHSRPSRIQREGSFESPGARLVARGAATRWASNEAPLALLSRQTEDTATATTSTRLQAKSASATIRSSQRRDIKAPGTSELSAPLGRSAASSAPTRRRAAVPALSRLLHKGPELLPASAASTARASSSAARTRSSIGSTLSPLSSDPGLTSSPTSRVPRRRLGSSSSETQQLLKRVASLKPGESIEAPPVETLADAGAMVARAALSLDAKPTRRGRAGSVVSRSRKVARREEGFTTRDNSLVDTSQLENLVRKELTTLSAPRPSINDAEIVRMAREVIASEGIKDVKRKAKAGAPGGGAEQQKDLDDLLHRLIRRMLIEEQIGGERTLTP